MASLGFPGPGDEILPVLIILEYWRSLDPSKGFEGRCVPSNNSYFEVIVLKGFIFFLFFLLTETI